MKIRTLAAALLLLCLRLPAQSPASNTAQTTQTPPPAGYTATLPLWPAASIPLAHTPPGTLTPGDTPKLLTYPVPGPGPHPAVIVMPGGGYTHLAIDKEGGAPARWLNAHGVTAFVLEYRLSPAYRFPAPILDGSRAVRYLRANASTLNLDPHRLGIWGFSAGGHLAGYLASVHSAAATNPVDAVDQQSDRPDFTILSYGRFDLGPTVPRPATTEAAPGMEIVLAATTAQIDIIPLINADNPPAFLYSTSGDQTVDSRNATAYYDALKRLSIPAELHIFELGAHGTGLADNASPTPTPVPDELAIWPLLLAHWMQQNRWMPAQQKPSY